MDRAHIRSGVLIKRYDGEKGHIVLENGSIAFPVTIGLTKGNDKIVPIVDEIVDFSTGADTVTEVTVSWAVQSKPDRYYRQRTKRDLTTEEISTRDTRIKNGLNELFDNQPEIKSLFDLCWRVAKGNVPGSALVNKAAFRSWFKDNLL